MSLDQLSLHFLQLIIQFNLEIVVLSKNSDYGVGLRGGIDCVHLQRVITFVYILLKTVPALQPLIKCVLQI